MTHVTPYVIRQTDQALEKAIAFIQAKRAGEISYGRHGRSAGCIVTHPSFRERWLKVKWWAAGEMIRFAWDGEVLAVGLEGVSKPRLFGFFDWEAIGVFYRAMMMSVAPGFFVKGRVLDHEPVLPPQWWEQLENAVAAIRARQTDRTYISEERVARKLHERFGLKVNLPETFCQTAHGDLHWGNLTAPEFSITDWETWGRAPYGFDVVQLHLFALTQPQTLAKLKDVFATVMARPEYDVTLLYTAGEEIRSLEAHGHSPELQVHLRAEIERVLAARRLAEYCE